MFGHKKKLAQKKYQEFLYLDGLAITASILLDRAEVEPEIMTNEYFEALRALNRARENFDNAEPEFFEAANAELTAAMERVNAFVREMRT